MSNIDTSEPPRTPRGGSSSSWARRFNDATLEVLAALARITGMCGVFVTATLFLGVVWADSWGQALRFAVSMIFMAAVTFGALWVGFRWLANPEWKDGGNG